MYTLTLLAKGGIGKTALSINLSVAAEAAGWRAALVDLDPPAWTRAEPRPERASNALM